MIKIIDSKRVDMTHDEYQMYQNICESYDNPPSQKGKDLFIDLFETDENGLILFVKPPRPLPSLLSATLIIGIPGPTP